MINSEREAEILRLFHVEKWRIGTIATQLGLHYSTVKRVLAQDGAISVRALSWQRFALNLSPCCPRGLPSPFFDVSASSSVSTPSAISCESPASANLVQPSSPGAPSLGSLARRFGIATRALADFLLEVGERPLYANPSPGAALRATAA